MSKDKKIKKDTKNDNKKSEGADSNILSAKAQKKRLFNQKQKEKIINKKKSKVVGQISTLNNQNTTPKQKEDWVAKINAIKQKGPSKPVKANDTQTTSSNQEKKNLETKTPTLAPQNTNTQQKDLKMPKKTEFKQKSTPIPVKTNEIQSSNSKPEKKDFKEDSTIKSTNKLTHYQKNLLYQKQKRADKKPFVKKTTTESEIVPEEKKDLYGKAEKLYLSKEAKIRVSSSSGGSNDFLIKKQADKGTLKDKISSLCVLIEENPKFCVKNLDSLLSITRNRDKKFSYVALEALKTLMTKNLKTHFLGACLFQTYVQKKPDMTETDLLDAYLCHGLKMFLSKFYKVLEDKLKDPLDYFRKKTIDFVCAFAKEFQDLENNGFLKLIVNKLGDSEEHIIQSLLKTQDIVINKNTNLAVKIQKEVQVLLNRQNLPSRVKFMAYTLLANVDYEKVQDKLVCTKSQEIFSKQCKELLNDDFTEESSKDQNQCLRGINRILPNLKDKEFITKFVTEHADYLFKLAHTSVPRVKIQILQVQYHILKSDQYSSQNLNRYYRVVYEMCLNPGIINSNLNEIFLEVLFNCMKDDLTSDRVHSFIKRLLQMAIHSEANVVVSILALIQKVGKARTDLSAFDISGKTMKNLLNDDDSEAPEDVEDSEDSVQESVHESTNSEKEDETEKYIKDMPSTSTNKPKKLEEHEEGFSYLTLTSNYDPYKIEPIYSGAKNTLYFELQYFLEHYHPTVRKIAEAIVEEKRFGAKSIEVSGNPLLDFSNNGFLNRLIQQKPKKRALYRKQNLMKRGRLGKYAYEEPFNVKDIYSTKQNSENENFIRKYFETKVNRLSYLEKRESKKTKKPENADIEEQEIDKYADEMFENELKKTDGQEDDDFMDGFDEDGDQSFSDDAPISDDEEEGMRQQGRDLEDDSMDEGQDGMNAEDFDDDMMADDFEIDEDEMRDADGFLGKRSKNLMAKKQGNRPSQSSLKNLQNKGLKSYNPKKKVKK